MVASAFLIIFNFAEAQNVQIYEGCLTSYDLEGNMIECQCCYWPKQDENSCEGYPCYPEPNEDPNSEEGFCPDCVKITLTEDESWNFEITIFELDKVIKVMDYDIQEHDGEFSTGVTIEYVPYEDEG